MHTTSTTNKIDFPEPTTCWPFPGPKQMVLDLLSLKEGGIESDMEAHNIRVCHGYDRLDNRGGVTIAYRKCSDWNNTRMVEVSLAYCSPQDTYNRKIGKDLAVNRFLCGNTVMVPARRGSDATIVNNLLDMFYNRLIW